MGVCNSVPLTEAPKANTEETQNMVLKHEIDKMKKQLQELKLNQVKNANDFRWEYQFRGDKWIPLDKELAAYLEISRIGETITIERGPGGEIINVISRDSINSAIVHCKYKSTVSHQPPRNCRRVGADDIMKEREPYINKKELDIRKREFNMRKRWVETCKEQQLDYKHNIAKLEQDNKNKSDQLKLLDLKMKQTSPVFMKINDEMNQIQKKKDKMTEGIPMYPDLTSTQSSKVFALKKLLDIDDDKSLIYLLKISQWKLSDAIDEYYKWSGKTDIEYISIWKWKSHWGQWNDYDDATNEIINELEVGKEISFRIFGRKDSYRFIKLTPDSGVQINESTKGRREAKRVSGIDYSDYVNEYPTFWNDKTICYKKVDEEKLYYLQSEKIRIDRDYIHTDLIDIDLNSSIAIAIKDNFYKSVGKDKYEITKIESVQNKFLWNGYAETRERLRRLIGERNMNEMHLWHEYDDSKINILYQGFRKEYNYGSQAGVLLYKLAWSCLNSKLLVCNVLCGESTQKMNGVNLRNWPLKNNGTDQLCDSLVDNINNPTEYYIHDDDRIYPLCVVHTDVKNGHL